MSLLIKISPELKGWIAHNLERGCPPAQLVASMVDQRFEPEIARGLIDAFVVARSTGVTPPDDEVMLDVEAPAYEYERSHLMPGNRIDAGDREIAVLMRLEQPSIAVLEGVLSAEECNAVIELASSRLEPSTVIDPRTGTETIANYRNSEGMFFGLCETPLIERLDRRISRLTNSPLENGEGLQVLRYGPGGHSAPHFDFLVPSNPANVASLARSGQRVASLVVYLNDVERGGETAFPEIGLNVSPRQGNAVYFEYANSRSQVDPRSLHSGAPVLAGVKWALTKWMRARPFVAAH
jgi:prolyl 4-hydroxylase